MNWFFASAAALSVVVGMAHSVLGEVLIFSRMRHGGFIPTNGARLIGEGHVRILWASWHVLTVFGWCIAAILFWLSQASQSTAHAPLAKAVALSMLVGAVLVFVGTKARHPGWAGLLGVAVLTWLGIGS
jgi:hypothetical protein